MAFPSQKKHSPARKKLGRGQYPAPSNKPPATFASILSVSLSKGISVSSPVATLATTETSISAGPILSKNPVLGVHPSAVLIPINSWFGGAPNVGDVWTFNSIPNSMTGLAAGLNWYPSAGLILA